ncbi:MAG: ribonuclease III [Pseudomonadota bacterium]
MSKLNQVSQRLGYTFNNPELLTQALTHRSVGANNNERLEFLGDAALNFVIADALYLRRPQFNEGELSRMRARLVRAETLAEVALELNLGGELRLGPGELKSGGFARQSILSDAVEAVIGAIFLDAGFETCRRIVLTWYAARLDNLPEIDQLKDAKTNLQEYVQAKSMALPVYEVIEKSGPPHEQMFTVKCTLPDSREAQATALGRRRAEQAVAALLLESIGID